MNRQEYAQIIRKRLLEQKVLLKEQFTKSGQIPSLIVDDLLPSELAKEIAQEFPAHKTLSMKNSLKEKKYVTSQMDQCPKSIEELTFAFQEQSVIEALEEITGMKSLLPDEFLYAAGISLMTKGCFLNPHLDNSHDLSGKRYRVLNLLFYVSEDWKLENGGNLELWDQGMKNKPRTVVSQFNRLVVMQTSRRSFHSVSEILSEQPRKCVSTYLFSQAPIEDKDYYHVTSFHARPEQKIRKIALTFDLILRNAIGHALRAITKGNIGTTHLYKKS